MFRCIVVAESAGYLVPGRHEVGAVAARDENGRLDHVWQTAAALLERDPQVRERLAGLHSDIAGGDDLPGFVKRAGACGKDKAGQGSRGGVCVRHALIQPVTANESHHAAECGIPPIARGTGPCRPACSARTASRTSVRRCDLLAG